MSLHVEVRSLAREHASRRATIRYVMEESDCVDELALGYGIGFTDPPDLTFADRMHRFVTLNRSPGTVRRVEAEARRDPLFDKTMVLLDDLFR